MIVLEIVLVIIGLGAVIFSSKLIDEGEKNIPERGGAESYDIPDEEGNISLQEDVRQFILTQETYLRDSAQNISSEIIMDTEDKLGNMANDKIMGIHEYSEQVIDKIEKNHGEVVFLYNMLNEKKKELDEEIEAANIAKQELTDEIVRLYKKIKIYAERVDYPENDAENEDKIRSDINNNVNIQSGNMDSLSEDDDENRNREIIEMYKNGKSILEISRLLDMGQGEVKFVIDLHANAS